MPCVAGKVDVGDLAVGVAVEEGVTVGKEIGVDEGAIVGDRVTVLGTLVFGRVVGVAAGVAGLAHAVISISSRVASGNEVFSRSIPLFTSQS